MGPRVPHLLSLPPCPQINTVRFSIAVGRGNCFARDSSLRRGLRCASDRAECAACKVLAFKKAEAKVLYESGVLGIELMRRKEGKRSADVVEGAGEAEKEDRVVRTLLNG